MTATRPSSELVQLRHQICHAFRRAAPSFEERSVIAPLAAEELIDRLAVVRKTPARILDIGAGTGRTTRQIAQRYPDAEIIAVDVCSAMFEQWPRARRTLSSLFGLGRHHSGPHRVVADAANLPLADASMDFVVSNLALPCCDPERFMAEVARVLTPGGVVMFTTVGPDTLRELAQAWESAGEAARLTPFPDMHDLGDIMLKAGLADPVVDMDMLTITHRHLVDLWADLRGTGSRCLRLDRTVTLTGRGTFRRVQEALDAQRDDAGLLRTTVELVHGHAFAPEAPAARIDGSGGRTEKSALKVHFQPQKQTD